MQSLKIASYDPGRIRDGFGMLGAIVDESHIYLKNATAWINTDSTDVTPEIAAINDKAKFDVHICETNNQGHFVIDTMKRYQRIHCQGITTVKDVKPEKMRGGATMPKNITVEWVEWARREGILVMPARSTWTDGMILLNRQLTSYVSFVSRTGVTYGSATEKDHDDLVACLLLLCHYARLHVLKIGYHDTTAFATHKSKVYAQILNMNKSNTDIETEKTTQNIKARVADRIPTNYKMKINGRNV